MNTTIREFNIKASNKFLVEKQLEKLNKRAYKLGQDSIEFVYGKAFKNKQDILMLPVELMGPLDVKFNGWEFVATIQHLDTGDNIVRNITNHEIPEKFRHSPKNCDHCQINRYRKDTYIVYHTESNEFCQVGSSCIKDFLGGNSPDHILQLAGILADLNVFMTGMGTGSNGPGGYYILDVLATTKALIKVFGWVPKSKADECHRSTASRFLDDPIACSEEDKEFAVKANEWVENLSDEEVKDSDYLFNIRAIARSGMADVRTIGYATSIVAAYERTLNKPSQVVSKHVGTLKKREMFNLTMKRELIFDGNYGTTYKYIFNDENGNIVTWNASNSFDFDKEAVYLIEGSIKAHVEYKGNLQTELTRCKVKGGFKNGKIIT
jgi:hypothetical protein